MTRKKVKLAWIVSDSARKASMRKRKQGLLKKVRELTILCGIHAFVVIYGCDNERPAVWPSRTVVQQLLHRFNESPEMDRSKKTTTQESYLKERIVKVQEQVRKQEKKNQQLVADQIMFRLSQGMQLCELETEELISLFWMAEEKMKETQKKIEYFEQAPELIPPPPPEDENMVDEQVRLTEDRLTEMDQWFINMMLNNKDVPGSSNASVYGARDCGGYLVNGGSQMGFQDFAGVEFNWADILMEYPQGDDYNGEQQMNELDLYLPQESYGAGQFGGLVEGGGGGEATVGGGFPKLNENNGATGELPDKPENMDFLMGDNEEDESSIFLQDFFDGINEWDHIFSP